MNVPKVCPLCNGKLMYCSGDGMWDSTYDCGSNAHKNYWFSCEARMQYVQIYDRASNTYIRWTIDKYGDIPPDTITIGTDFSPYKNEKITWDYESKLMNKFKEVISKIEIQEIFS